MEHPKLNAPSHLSQLMKEGHCSVHFLVRDGIIIRTAYSKMLSMRQVHTHQCMWYVYAKRHHSRVAVSEQDQNNVVTKRGS